MKHRPVWEFSTIMTLISSSLVCYITSAYQQQHPLIAVSYESWSEMHFSVTSSGKEEIKVVGLVFLMQLQSTCRVSKFCRCLHKPTHLLWAGLQPKKKKTKNNTFKTTEKKRKKKKKKKEKKRKKFNKVKLPAVSSFSDSSCNSFSVML